MNATGVVTGFDVDCPHCADEDAAVTLNLVTLECHCEGCDATFTVESAVDACRAQLEAWEAVARWMEMIPTAKLP